jgi:dGTPase
MDLSDAITYSVHDLEDFFRAGLIPIERIVKNRNYRTQFLSRWKALDNAPTKAIQYAKSREGWAAISNLLSFILADTSESGSQREAELLETFRSAAITRFISGVKVNQDSGGVWKLALDDKRGYECKFLQRLVYDYVIYSPRLATQQAGQVKVVDALAEFFLDALRGSRLDRIPVRFQAMARQVCDEASERVRARLAIDIVASLTEGEAVSLYRRVSGQRLGTLHELVA